MLVDLATMKDYLGETTNTYDTFLTQQLTLVSDAIEGYCGRKFESATYTQLFYWEDIQEIVTDIPLYHYPVTSVTSVTDVTNTLVYDAADYKVVPLKWLLRRRGDKWFTDSSEEIEVIYTAGYVTIPTPITSVVFDLVEERYNKKTSNMNMSFGKDVQRVSIPGAIAIDYDYSLTANERVNKYGMILGNHLNVLDPYRSERSIIGSAGDIYVS